MAETATNHTDKTAAAVNENVGRMAADGRAALAAGVKANAEVARDGLQRVQRVQHAATAFGNVQRELARHSAQNTVEFGRLLAKLAQEQTRHGLETATAFGRAVDWSQIATIQRDFVQASLQRVSELNGRYLKSVQAVMGTVRDEAGKSA